MTLAEEAAEKAYPFNRTMNEIHKQIDIEAVKMDREAFVNGYEQAEKDLIPLPGLDEPKGIPGKDFIPVAWVDACELYGKWKIVRAEKDLGWHSVEESLPPVDEEVIVLTDRLNLGALFAISFGHIVSKMHCWDYNGWNIPGVKYWMPMPKIPNEDE